MRHPVGLLSCFLLLTSPVLAQDLGRAWREEVDLIVSRWTDGQPGASRLERALDVVQTQIRRDGKDGEAQLEKARILTAEPVLAYAELEKVRVVTAPTQPSGKDPHKAAELAAKGYQLAQDTAETAAELLRVKARTGESPEVATKADERRNAAMAVAYLALHLQLREELERVQLIPSKESEKKRILQQQAAKLERRRAALYKACGGEERAKAMVEKERLHLRDLQQVDRLGGFPRPIGQNDTDGKPVDLTSYKGKLLLVVFWSSRIESSKNALQEVKAVHEKYGEKGLEVLGVNMDEKREDLDAFLSEVGVTWRHCFEGRGMASNIARAWSVRSVPDGVLIDHTGRIRYLRPWEMNLKLAVEELLDRRGKP